MSPILRVQLAADCVLCISDGGCTGGSAVGVLPRVSLCYLNTMLLCFCRAGEATSQINFEDADCFVIHTLCQVLMACCVFMVGKEKKNQREESTGVKKAKWERVSYLKKHFNTSNCKEGGREGDKRGEREIEIRLPKGAVEEQQLSETLWG